MIPVSCLFLFYKCLITHMLFFLIQVYQGATLLSIFHPEWALLCNMVRDIYEAYVLYIFM